MEVGQESLLIYLLAVNNHWGLAVGNNILIRNSTLPSGSWGLPVEKCVPASEVTPGELVHCCGLYCRTALTGVYVAGLYPNGALRELEERADRGVW